MDNPCCSCKLLTLCWITSQREQREFHTARERLVAENRQLADGQSRMKVSHSRGLTAAVVPMENPSCSCKRWW